LRLPVKALLRREAEWTTFPMLPSANRSPKKGAIAGSRTYNLF
jgi:hypothetical protein